MGRRRWEGCSGLLVAALIAMSCGAEEADILRIGTNVWPGYEPLYLARGLGFLGEDDFRLVEYSNSSEVIRNFRNGAIDAAALTLDEVLLLAQNGVGCRVVMVMDISHGGDVIIGRPGVESLEDLRGGRVGVENTALGAFVLARALEISGQTATSMDVVSATVDRHEDLFRSQAVDAVVTFEPVRSRLLAAGGSLLFDSTQIPGEIVDVLIVDPHYLEQNPEKVRKLATEWFRALAHMEEHPSDAWQRIAERLNITPDEVPASFAGLRLPNREENRRMLGAAEAEPELMRTAEYVAEIMIQKHLLSGEVEIEELFGDVSVVLR